MWTVNDFDYVPDLDGILLQVERLCIAIFTLLLQRLRLGLDQFATHGENLEAFLFQAHYHAYGLRVQHHQITPLELAKRVDTCGHVRAELQVTRQHFQLVHGQVGEEHHTVLLNTDNQSSVTLITPLQHFYVVALLEEFAQLACLEFKSLLQNTQIILLIHFLTPKTAISHS